MRRGIVYIDDNYVEFGQFNNSHNNIRIIYKGDVVWGISYDALKKYLGFNIYCPLHSLIIKLFLTNAVKALLITVSETSKPDSRILFFNA